MVLTHGLHLSILPPVRVSGAHTHQHLQLELERLCSRSSQRRKQRCHALIPDMTRMADLNRFRGARLFTGTLYLLFQTLVGPSLIIESKYHIQNKTTIVVVFTISIHTALSPIYI